MKIPTGKDVMEIVEELKNHADVEIVEPNYIYKVQASPNDYYFVGGYQWGLSRIAAPSAWDTTVGSRSVIVAVLDTGADSAHPDLQANLIAGQNFVDPPYSMEDGVLGHGTFVSGILGAAGNNSIGIAGTNWNVGIMPLKVCNNQGNCPSDAIANAIYYAADNGVKIINASFGGYGYSSLQYNAINHVRTNHDVLFVAAAGNGPKDASGNQLPPTNNDVSPCYPASYGLDNIISVAASNSSDYKDSSSNWGPNSVHVAAPGRDIVSTYPVAIGGFYYAQGSGTSFAAPFVAGTAALLKSVKQAATYTEIRSAILNNADYVSALDGLIQSGRRHNAFAAVQQLACPNNSCSTWTQNIYPSWNMISLPYQPANTTIENVLKDISGKYSIVWSYVNGQWKVYDPTDIEGSTFSTMEAGRGYEINMHPDASGNLLFTGTTPGLSIDLIQGWNYIGYNKTQGMEIQTALQSIAGKYTIVWQYKNDTKQWLAYDPSDVEGSDLLAMSPGNEYQINMTQAATLTYPQ